MALKSCKTCPKCGNVCMEFTFSCDKCGYSFSSPQQQPSLPKCPKCGSTAIATGARGFNLMSGMLGASKTVNRCANCGHTWKPNGK